MNHMPYALRSKYASMDRKDMLILIHEDLLRLAPNRDDSQPTLPPTPPHVEYHTFDGPRRHWWQRKTR